MKGQDLLYPKQTVFVYVRLGGSDILCFHIVCQYFCPLNFGTRGGGGGGGEGGGEGGKHCFLAVSCFL